MRKSAVLSVVVTSLLLIAPVVADDTMNVLRLSFVYSQPTGSGRVSVDPIHKFEADNAFGPAVSYERTLSALMGVNFDLSRFNYDMTITQATPRIYGDFSMMPLTLSLLFHPFERGEVDFYLGPGLSYVKYGDLNVHGVYVIYSGKSKLSVDKSFSPALQTGLDIHLGRTWGVNVDLKYINTKAKIKFPDFPFNVKINPILLGVGVSARF